MTKEERQAIEDLTRKADKLTEAARDLTMQAKRLTSEVVKLHHQITSREAADSLTDMLTQDNKP